MKKNWKGFIIGVLLTTLVSSLIVPAVARSQVRTITVEQGGINIFVDGNLRIPTDANGNVVEPFVHAGVTYLPLRPLTNMLTDKAVNWDGATRSIYIGERPTAASTPMHELAQHQGAGGFATGSNAQFRILDETISPFNSMRSRHWVSGRPGYWRTTNAVYLLNSQYSAINGEFIVSFSRVGDSGVSRLIIETGDARGNFTVLQQHEARVGDPPITVNTSLVGVDILRIRFEGNSDDGRFYNVTLTGR
jgi:hypothetical protein